MNYLKKLRVLFGHLRVFARRCHGNDVQRYMYNLTHIYNTTLKITLSSTLVANG